MSQQERLEMLLSGSDGDSKIVSALELILELSAPDFIFKVKGMKAFPEIKEAASAILTEEKAKGMDGLYDRIKQRLENYWNEPLEQI